MVTTIDQKIAEFFNSIQPGGWPWGNFILCVIAIVLSVILCGVIGLEREKRGRSAGLRTHLLVGVGSCIIMIISIYGFPTSEETKRDVARLAAQVIAGVGFLGAGAIIHNQGGIRGLTTASTIWLVMALGLACGSMNFILAIGSTVVIMIVLTVFRKFEQHVTKNNPTVIILTDSEMPVMSILLEVAKIYDCTLSDVVSNMVQDGNTSKIEVTFRLNLRNNKVVDVEEVVRQMGLRTKAINVQIVNHH